MLFICQAALPTSGGYSSVLWAYWTPEHATRYKFHNLLCLDVHGSPPGKQWRFFLPPNTPNTEHPQVALTSPDPDLNSDAREYFTRHMRILEKCSSSWPMPDMQQQIDALREAFSADTRKPFVLKPSFPYGSPGAPVNTTPPRGNVQYRQASQGSQNLEQGHAPQQVSYTAHPISPPISAGGVDTKSDSPAVQSLVMMATGHRAPQAPLSSGVPMADPSTWNPSRIFE